MRFDLGLEFGFQLVTLVSAMHRSPCDQAQAALTQVINLSGDSGDGVVIGGEEPKAANHTPQRVMRFKSIG